MNADFAAALLDPARPLPAGLVGWNGADPGPRFAVYRNNVISSLVDALADNCPVVLALVGEEFFRAMSAIYVRRHPPRSPILAHYGADFDRFIADFEPAARLPYLADIARLETARQVALHAADTPVLTLAAAQEALAAVTDPEQLARLRLLWHPSVTVIRSAHAVVSLWAAHQTDGEPDLAPVSIDEPESAVVVRDGLEVIVLPLSERIATFVEASLAGQPLRQADVDLATALPPLLRHGALTALDLPGPARRTSP